MITSNQMHCLATGAKVNTCSFLLHTQPHTIILIFDILSTQDCEKSHQDQANLKEEEISVFLTSRLILSQVLII